jgi:hypothetical protein
MVHRPVVRAVHPLVGDLMEISLSPHVTLQPMDDGAMLVDRAGEPYFQLDDLGARLWQLLAENGELERAETQLLAEFDIEEDVLRREVRELLEEMAQADLVAWT